MSLFYKAKYFRKIDFHSYVIIRKITSKKTYKIHPVGIYFITYYT